MSCIHPHIPIPNAPHMEQIQDDPPVQEKYFLVAPKRLVQPVQCRSLVQISSVCHDENSVLLVLININHLPVGKLNASFLVLDHIKIMAFQTFQMGKQIVQDTRQLPVQILLHHIPENSRPTGSLRTSSGKSEK